MSQESKIKLIWWLLQWLLIMESFMLEGTTGGLVQPPKVGPT